MSSDPSTDHDSDMEISVREVARLQAENLELVLLDCREASELALNSLPGAVHIPMLETPQRLAELDAFRETPLVVYCHLGARSLQVARWLRNHGFPKARSMSGGIDAWSQEIDESVPRY